MASYLEPIQFQQSAFAGQFTPPPSPGNEGQNVITYTANTGKLRRPKTPEPLTLLGLNHNDLSKYLASTNSKAKNDAYPLNATADLALTPAETLSPLSPNFIIKDTIEVSGPQSESPTEPRHVDVTTAQPKQDIAPLITTRQKSTALVPTSTSIPIDPPLTNTNTTKASIPVALPPLITLPTRSGIQRSFSISRTQKLEKELPPPPFKSPALQTVISPGMTFNSFPMPGPAESIKRSQNRILRKMRSIGLFHSGSKTRSSTSTEFETSTIRSHRSFHNRILSGGMFRSSKNGSAPSTHSDETSTISHSRRLSHLQRRKNSVPEDPLAPVSVLPVMTNHEDVVGGLTYLPRYTNNFAGFCKSAWRLQLSDPKSFDIKNRNSSHGTPTLKCSKCLFEGPIHPQKVLGSQYVWARIPDSKVYSSFGVTYTWQFLFKSHLAQKKGTSQNSHTQILPASESKGTEIDMGEGLFGCIFCCVRGIGTPVFKGPEALSWHLRSHANDRIEDREIQHRFKIIIGREPEPMEKFDVHIPHLIDSNGHGASMSVRVGGDGKWEEPGKIIEESESSPPQYDINPIARPSTPMLYLDIQNDKSWEIKMEEGIDRIDMLKDHDVRM